MVTEGPRQGPRAEEPLVQPLSDALGVAEASWGRDGAVTRETRPGGLKEAAQGRRGQGRTHTPLAVGHAGALAPEALARTTGPRGGFLLTGAHSPLLLGSPWVSAPLPTALRAPSPRKTPRALPGLSGLSPPLQELPVASGQPAGRRLEGIPGRLAKEQSEPGSAWIWCLGWRYPRPGKGRRYLDYDPLPPAGMFGLRAPPRGTRSDSPSREGSFQDPFPSVNLGARGLSQARLPLLRLPPPPGEPHPEDRGTRLAGVGDLRHAGRPPRPGLTRSRLLAPGSGWARVSRCARPSPPRPAARAAERR